MNSRDGSSTNVRRAPVCGNMYETARAHNVQSRRGVDRGEQSAEGRQLAQSYCAALLVATVFSELEPHHIAITRRQSTSSITELNTVSS